MSNILITGGTGTLGKSLTKILEERNVPYTLASRNNNQQDANRVKMDLLKNTGVVEAVKGMDIIFHLATDLKKDNELTYNLLLAIDKNSNVHLIYISIVGIDKVPLSYYKQKLASENAIKESGVRYTILRATQFHEFINTIISTFLKFPIGLLPKKVISQPIQTEIVAVELYQLSLRPAANKTYEIGGQEALTMQQMAKDWMEQAGKKRWILNMPIWGKLGSALCNGSLATANARKESISWRKWLKKNKN